MSAALRSVGLLDVLFKYVCGALGRAPCIHARLHRLATNPGEKSGLEGKPRRAATHGARTTGGAGAD